MAGEPTVVLIPARLRSTRLPDKPLAEIGGVPMVRTTPLLSFKGGSHRPR
jgi:3-deoxy-manno-octulosonate cytidylyltransferase (CMP-KDO synthetase)